jgi:hypothetical protein
MFFEGSSLILVANLSNTIVCGVEIYQKGKDQLRDAIRQYDRAVMHLTARAVARTYIWSKNISNHRNDLFPRKTT